MTSTTTLFRPRLLATLIAAIALLAAGTAGADRRSFAHTYEYTTMPRGGLELELDNTQTRPALDGEGGAFQLQIETEYGITDHWDIALYQVIAQDAEDGSPLRYTETKIETRIRFGERGDLFVDPLLYFEVAKSMVGRDLELEAKIVLARDFGPLTVALNLIGELGIEDEAEVVPGWALGASYEVTPAWKLGAELFGELAEGEAPVAGEEGDRELVAWAGPTLSWAPDPKVWITVNAAFGLTDHSDDFIARFILGVGL